MCKLRRKLLLFDYTVGKLVEWETKSDLKILSDENINNSLTNFTSVGFMKLLYFICLQSVHEKYAMIDRKQKNDCTIDEKDNLDLFKIFDNFVALPKGPAEDDVYSHRSTLLSYRYDDMTKHLKVNTKYMDIFKFSYPGVKPQDYEEKNKVDILKEQIELSDNPKDKKETPASLEGRNTDGEMDSSKKKKETPLSDFVMVLDKAIDQLKLVFAEKNISLTNSDYLVELTHNLPLWNYYIRCENNKYCLNEEELKKEADLFFAV